MVRTSCMYRLRGTLTLDFHSVHTTGIDLVGFRSHRTLGIFLCDISFTAYIKHHFCNINTLRLRRRTISASPRQACNTAYLPDNLVLKSYVSLSSAFHHRSIVFCKKLAFGLGIALLFVIYDRVIAARIRSIFRTSSACIDLYSGTVRSTYLLPHLISWTFRPPAFHDGVGECNFHISRRPL